MKQALLTVLLLLVVVVGPAAAQDEGWPRTLADGLGNEVTIAAPPERIVSLSLAVDETLLPILGPERFAAVTALAQDPGISNVAVQATAVDNVIVSSDDTEQIIALEPDLVFAASFTAPETIQQLKDAGLTVFITTYPVGLEAIRENARLLGAAVGQEEAVEALLAEMDSAIAAVGEAVCCPETPIRALYLTPGNFTSGTNSTIAEVIEAAGGRDVAADAGMEQFAALSDEFIIEQNPDVILLTGWTPYDPTFVETFMINPAFADLDAVRNGTVYIANDAHLTSVSPFVAEGVKDVAAYLYPELYPTFPVTVRDGQGRAIQIGERPDVVLFDGFTQILSPMDRILQAIDTEDMTIYMGGISEEREGLENVDVAFLRETVPYFPSERTVIIHPNETPAEDVANMMIIGEALGDRVATLNAIAQYLDQLEAIAAGDM